MLFTLGVVMAEDGGGQALPAVSGEATEPIAAEPIAGQSYPTQQQPGGLFGFMVPLLLMFGIVYFLMIRPQQKKLKDHQSMLGELKHGDDVVMTSGMIGKVTGITDKVITLEIANNVRIKMLKGQVAQIVKGQIKDLA